MGVSLALVFHVASALALCLLLGWGLRLQRDIRCLRQMVSWADATARRGSGGASRVPAKVPALIRRLARAAGLEVTGKLENEGAFPLSVVDPGPLSQLFLRGRASLVQFNHSTVTIRTHVGGAGGPAVVPGTGELRQSLANAVEFVISSGEDDA